MQFQADVLGVPVVVPEVAETTALGAAMLAGVGAAVWSQDQVVQQLASSARATSRAMGAAERETLLADWTRARSRARGWASE